MSLNVLISGCNETLEKYSLFLRYLPEVGRSLKDDRRAAGLRLLPEFPLTTHAGISKAFCYTLVIILLLFEKQFPQQLRAISQMGRVFTGQIFITSICHRLQLLGCRTAKINSALRFTRATESCSYELELAED